MIFASVLSFSELVCAKNRSISRDDSWLSIDLCLKYRFRSLLALVIDAIASCVAIVNFPTAILVPGLP